MPSHVYIFDHECVPDWSDRSDPPTDAASLAARRRIAACILEHLPGAVEAIDLRDDRQRWIVIDMPGFDVTIEHDHVHVRVRYWSEHELERLGVPQHLELLVQLLESVAGYGSVEHGDQGLGSEARVEQIVPLVAECGERWVAAMSASFGSLGAPYRGSELAW